MMNRGGVIANHTTRGKIDPTRSIAPGNLCRARFQFPRPLNSFTSDTTRPCLMMRPCLMDRKRGSNKSRSRGSWRSNSTRRPGKFYGSPTSKRPAASFSSTSTASVAHQLALSNKRIHQANFGSRCRRRFVVDSGGDANERSTWLHAARVTTSCLPPRRNHQSWAPVYCTHSLR